ncbi:MAG: hypothetical protein AAGC78_05100 [Cellvibrio sp.]|uniref:hypothetical protein n=1 Tax=Cellvibrio sp. TaxID=1965322 RepID=UPI0031B51995
MKQLLKIGTALALGVLLGSYGKSKTENSAGAQPLIAPVQAMEVEQLKTQNANLLQENSSLRQQLLAVVNQLQQITVQSSSSIANVESADIKNQNELEINTLKSKIISDKIIKKLNDHSNDLSSTLAQEFNNEAINYEWAEAEQQKLSSWFSNDAEFAGLALQSVSCRTTQCKISVAAVTHEQANNIVTTLSHALKEHYESSVYFSDTNLTRNTTELYISFAPDDAI